MGIKDQKGKKRLKKKSSDGAEPVSKKQKTDAAEMEFSHIKFKFLLRSPETVATGLQTFLDISCKADDDDDDNDNERLLLLEAYLKSSPQCSEVLDLITPKTSAIEISLLFTWLRHVLQECPRVMESFADLQHHLVKTLLTKHTHLVINSLRKGSKPAHVKSTLLLLVTIASLGLRFAKLLQLHLDFTHTHWVPLLSYRDRKDEADVRACMTAFLMKLLQVEDEELIRSLVDQKALLQEVMVGLKYDQSEYVAANLKTIHKSIVLNKSVGKSAKMYLFNSSVLKELLTLYQWPGPKHWKRQPSQEEKVEYSEDQKEIAELLHPLLLDLLANHKLGICFRDKSLGLSNDNKNPAVNKVLQALVTSYTSPLSHRLVTAILTACPDQVQPFLRLLQPNLVPRPVDTWLTCLHLFLQIMENHEWPVAVIEGAENATQDRVSKLAHYLFPPDGIISSLKDGLKHACATVRHLCLQTLEQIASRGRQFCDMSRKKLGDQAPLTLCIEGILLKTLPNGQVLLNLLHKFSSKDSFTVPVSRDLYKDTDVPLPHVSRFQHLVAILRTYSLVPEHLTGGPVDALPLLLTLVAQVRTSDDETDSPPEGTPANLLSLCLLHALSECDSRKLQLFGKGGSKVDVKQTLVYQLVCLMQAESGEEDYTQTAHSLIVKLLAGTGLFDGHERELAIWLHYLKDADSAPEEVVQYLVGLLRQFIPNPYPAIDRLLEQVEESPQLIEGQYLPYVRLEFSPLVMFALGGDFHKNKKVHHYICNVLIDILHSLHNPAPFSRLVHSLAGDLDPEVTQYLTFHTADEEATSESITKRMCKKVRLKQLKSSAYAGVTLMKKAMKVEGEVKQVVGEVPAGDCLSLVEQSLRYLDDMVAGCMNTKGELLNKKLAETCMETLRTASHRLAEISRTDNNTSPEKGTHSESAVNVTAENMEVDEAADEAYSSDSEIDDDKETRNRSKIKEHRKRKTSFNDDSDVSMDDGENDDDIEEEEDDNDRSIADGKVAEEPASLSDPAGEKDVGHEAPGLYCAALHTDLGMGQSSTANLFHLTTNWSQQVYVCLLRHPLVSKWLWMEGFTQGGKATEWIVHQLCDVIQTLTEIRGSDDGDQPVVKVTDKCRDMIQAACGVSSDGQHGVAESIQPLFCECLQTLLLVGGDSHRVECLLALVRLPAESFVAESAQTPTTVLAQMLFKLAEGIKLDTKIVKELAARQDVATSFEGLFDLISVLDCTQLESLAVKVIESIPELSLSCGEEAFKGMLNKLNADASPSLTALAESLMRHNPQCRSLCGQWLTKKKKTMKQRKLEFAPLMLTYLNLVLGMKDTAADDAGVCAITEAVCHGLDKQSLDADNVHSSFLHVICHLVNCDIIETKTMHKLRSNILLLVTQEATLLEAHVQLLAAILRQEALAACGLDLGTGAADLEKGWKSFEDTAGQVLLGCLRYLMNKGLTAEVDECDAESCQSALVHLCYELLSLPIQSKVKTDVVSIWPDLVSTCFKYHFKDAKYVLLLRQLVERVFVQEEERAIQDVDENIDDDAEKQDDLNISGKADDSASDEDDGDEGMEPTGSVVKKDTTGDSKPQARKASAQQKKHFSIIVAQSAKRLGLASKSDVGKKCMSLFSADTDTKMVTPHTETVNSWTGRGSVQSTTFFPWPNQHTSQVHTTNSSLASPSLGVQLVELCEKCVGHTAFLPIMQGGELGAVRGELVSLLACLVRLEKKCCSALPLKAFLAAYSATLSLTDQNLLYLMFACDLHGKQRLKPGLWGEKAVQQLEMKQQMGRSLLLESSLGNVLELLDPDVMATSILHFPLMRSMEYQHTECAQKAERMMSQDGCYDPRFLLQVLFHFMGPEYVVDVRTFISHKCLGYTLAALSSHDTHTRRLAIGILSNLHSHVDLITRWSAKPVLLTFLKVISHGMTKECQKLPSVVTVFLARAADIFMKPTDDMYIAIHNFLTLKAGLDVNNVPEFYHFFNSPKPKERQWILQLLQDGLRETSDHRLFQRRYVYKLIMCYANSSLSDQQTRRESVKVLVKASTIATVAKDLVTKHGLLPWLVSFIKDTLPDTADATHLVCQLLHNVCYTTEFNSRRLWWLSVTRLSRQCLLHVPLLVCVRLLLLNFSHVDLRSLQLLLDVLLHPHLTPSSPSTLLPLVVMATWNLSRQGSDAEATEVAAELAGSLGLSVPTVTATKPPQGGDKDAERREARRKEKVVEMGKQVQRLLSSLDPAQQSVFVMSGEGNQDLAVKDVVSKLEKCRRCQY
ncbi:nucleolar pre-ribosomal-associated protein 1-like [Littorina saxatilis]|uniref:Nucleolar pre-ribosomal-associated protein 1 n=1 Tax=Littorina saxatilis TaxID=31220 RepID=A0AAN9GI35_9CAEN